MGGCGPLQSADKKIFNKCCYMLQNDTIEYRRNYNSIVNTVRCYLKCAIPRAVKTSEYVQVVHSWEDQRRGIDRCAMHASCVT